VTTVRDLRLADLSDAISIHRGFPTQRATPDGDVRVMSIAALRNGSPPKFFADQPDLDDLGLAPARPGDVLISIEGGTVGETMVVPDGIGDFVPSQQVATLRVVGRDDLLDPGYIGAWLSAEPARGQLGRLARGSGIQRIALKDLGALVLRVPPLSDQVEIGARYLAFEDAIRTHRAVAACLEDVRDADLVVVFSDGAR
jgi:hypothetical protein